MADELEIDSRISFIRDVIRVSHPERGNSSFKTFSGGPRASYSKQTVGIYEPGEPLNTGDVSNGGFIYIENTDRVNFVKLVEKETMTCFCKILPGEFAFFRSGATFDDDCYVVASREPCDILVIAFQGPF